MMGSEYHTPRSILELESLLLGKIDVVASRDRGLQHDLGKPVDLSWDKPLRQRRLNGISSGSRERDRSRMDAYRAG
jgi:hypothetical protein